MITLLTNDVALEILLTEEFLLFLATRSGFSLLIASGVRNILLQRLRMLLQLLRIGGLTAEQCIARELVVRNGFPTCSSQLLGL